MGRKLAKNKSGMAGLPAAPHFIIVYVLRREERPCFLVLSFATATLCYRSVL